MFAMVPKSAAKVIILIVLRLLITVFFGHPEYGVMSYGVILKESLILLK